MGSGRRDKRDKAGVVERKENEHMANIISTVGKCDGAGLARHVSHGARHERTDVDRRSSDGRTGVVSAKQQRTGRVVSCAVCGKEVYRSGAFIKPGKEYFCSTEHAQNHRKVSRRKVSACIECGKEMNGDDLKRFWGKTTPDGLCRDCKATKDKARRAMVEQRDRERREKRDQDQPPCPKCGRRSVRRLCRFCDAREYNKITHARCMHNPKKHLNLVIRTSLRQCLRGEKKRRRSFDLVGYSVDQLKNHLENQFAPGMTWENYGSEWHIDHIVPLSAFNFSTAEDPDFKRAWALSNLRPLWAMENLRKGARVESPFQPFLAMGAM